MSRFFPTSEECGHHVFFGSTQVKTYASDHMQLSLASIPADGVVDWHSHPNEQLGVMISGQATFHIGDEVKTIGPGEFFFIPGGVRHKVVPVNGPVLALDVFYPIRDEYR